MANIAASKPQLLDQFGHPIDTTRLKQQLAGPTTTGVRSVITGHPAKGLSPERLASILRSAEHGNPITYLELAEQMEEKDLHYLGVLGTRKRQVAQLEITVEAAGEDADAIADADLIRDWLNRDTLEDELFDILDAVGKGFSLTELVWATSETQWWVERMQWVDPRWVEFDRTDGRTPRLVSEGGQAQALDPFKYVFAEIKAKSGLPIRGGLARPVAWMWMFKNYAIKDWVAFAEVYGLPFRLGKYDESASAEQRDVLLRAVRDMGSDAAAIIPRSMEVQFVNAAAGTGGAELFSGMAQFFDDQVSKAVLGQTATTDAKIGGLGSGKEHGEVRDDIARADAKALAAALNRDLVRPMVDLNRGKPKLGRYPRLVIGRAESWDAVKMMPAVREFVSMGGRVAESTIRDRLGLPDPGKNEVLLSASAGAPQTPPGAPGARPTPIVPAKPGATGFLGRLKLLSGASGIAAAAENAAGGVKGDAIDRAIADALDDWQPAINGSLDAIRDLVDQVGSLDELREQLLAALPAMDEAELRQLLEPLMFAAYLAGAAGDDLA